MASEPEDDQYFTDHRIMSLVVCEAAQILALAQFMVNIYNILDSHHPSLNIRAQSDLLLAVVSTYSRAQSSESGGSLRQRVLDGQAFCEILKYAQS